jgi:hypothetical protein
LSTRWPRSTTKIRTESIAGVSFALVIIGVRCDPSPAHEVHWSTPGDLMASTLIVTVSEPLPPPLSCVATKNSGALFACGADRVEARSRQAVWKCPRCRPSLLRKELSR